MYPTVTESGTSSQVGHVQGKWNGVAAQCHSAIAFEHVQLVDAVQATDGVSREQAEMQVSAFEKQFRDDPL